MKIFDFDGTLVDLWPRYYAVFCELTNCNVSLDRYKDVKRNFVRDERVAAEFGIALSDIYFDRKAILLEEKEFLKLDKLWLSVADTISLFEADGSFILSKRRNRDMLMWQLSYLGLDELVSKTHVVSDSKKEWVLEHFPTCDKIIIGDSLQDLEIGELPDTECIMVGCGLLQKSDFDEAKIHYTYCDTICDVIKCL